MRRVLAFSKLAEVPGSQRSYLVTDHDLTPWRYKEFRMRAKNSLGEGFPSKIPEGCITGTIRKYKGDHLLKTDPVMISRSGILLALQRKEWGV